MFLLKCTDPLFITFFLLVASQGDLHPGAPTYPNKILGNIESFPIKLQYCSSCSSLVSTSKDLISSPVRQCLVTCQLGEIAVTASPKMPITARPVLPQSADAYWIRDQGHQNRQAQIYRSCGLWLMSWFRYFEV